MKVVFIIPKINLGGGGSNSNTDLRIRALLGAGHEVTVITLFSTYNRLPIEKPYKIISLDYRPRRWFLLNLRIFQLLTRYAKSNDLLYIDGPQFLIGAGLYKIFGNKPVLIHLNVLPYFILDHGTRFFAELGNKHSLSNIKYLLREKIGRYFDLWLSKKIDFFSCTSPVIMEQCAHFGFDQSRMMVLPEFIDTAMFLTKTLRLSHTKRSNLIYVGRLVPCKGVDLLIRAINDIGVDNIRLNIVGNGPEMIRLKTLVTNLNLNKSITFLGWVDRARLKDIYATADIFVHPARWAEPLGITIVEAMAAQLPVIVPQISGSAWAAGQAGLTFNNGDVKDLTNKIKLLLKDDSVYNKLKKQTLNETKKMDYTKWAPVFIELINRLVKK